MAGNIQRHQPDKSIPTAARSHPLMNLRDEVDRLFESFFPATGTMFELDPFRRIGHAFRSAGDITPEVDVKETDDHIEICAELAGMDENDVDVTVREHVLSIAGEKKSERKEEKADYHLTERSYGSFVRAFRLPDTADVDNVDADFSKGVLTIKIPKKADAQQAEKKIQVKRH